MMNIKSRDGEEKETHDVLQALLERSRNVVGNYRTVLPGPIYIRVYPLMIYVVMGEKHYRDGGEPLAWAATKELAEEFIVQHRRKYQKWYNGTETLVSYDEFQENPIYEEFNPTKLASALKWGYYWIVEVEEHERN